MVTLRRLVDKVVRVGRELRRHVWTRGSLRALPIGRGLRSVILSRAKVHWRDGR